MKNRLMGIVLIVVVMASAVSAKPLSSPTNAKFVAKVGKSLLHGQQLFFSYDGGKQYQQITWLGGQIGQVVDCIWTRNGYLVLGEYDIEVQDRINQGYKHMLSDPTRSLGVFDPSKKVIYWVGGTLADSQADWGLADVDKVKVSKDKISFQLTRYTPSRFQQTNKIVQVPQGLVKAKQDHGPLIVYFGYEIKKAAQGGSELGRLLDQVRKQDRLKLSRRFRENRRDIARADVDLGGNLLMIDAGYPGVPPGEGGAPEFELDLTYNPKTRLFSLQY